MRDAVTISAALHVVVLTVSYFGLPALFDAGPPADVIIPVEVVTIAAETTPAPVEPPAEKKPEVPPPVAKPEPAPPEKKQPPPEPAAAPPEPVPEPETVVAALPPESEAKPEPPPKPAAKPQPPKRRPALRRPPKPLPKPAKPESFDSARISALIDKSRERKPQVLKPPPTAAAPAPTAAAVAPPSPIETALTVSEKDFIRLKFRDCWSIPSGAKDFEGMEVTVRIYLNRDGSLSDEPKVVDQAERRRAAADVFYRVFVESAVRAVRKCDPLEMPPRMSYEKWREIEFTFSPRDMLG